MPNQRLNENLAGYPVVDEVYTFNLNESTLLQHDLFYIDTLIIRTVPFGNATNQVPSTSYRFDNLSSRYQGPNGESIYGAITITDPTYAGIPLYISLRYLGDVNDAKDINDAYDRLEVLEASDLINIAHRDIIDGNPHGTTSDQVVYDNSASSLVSTNVEAALNELDTKHENESIVDSSVALSNVNQGLQVDFEDSAGNATQLNLDNMDVDTVDGADVDTDNTLGGGTPDNVSLPTQQAIREFLTTNHYTKTELDTFFEGEDAGRKQIDWDRVINKPSLGAPIWSTPVPTFADLPAGTQDGETRIVQDDGDGKPAQYVWDATGTQWVKFADVDWGDASALNYDGTGNTASNQHVLPDSTDVNTSLSTLSQGVRSALAQVYYDPTYAYEAGEIVVYPVSGDRGIIFLECVAGSPITPGGIPHDATEWKFLGREINSQVLRQRLDNQSEKKGIIIPLYLYPTDIYTNTVFNDLIALIKLYHDVPVYVVFNPANGPGLVTDGNYTAAIQRLQGAGAITMGYVSTDYGAVALGTIIQDIQAWKTYYPDIDGIFVDEMTNAFTVGNINLYKSVYNFCQTQGFFYVISNPGSQPAPEYFQNLVADNILIHENSVLPIEANLLGDFDNGNADYPTNQRGVLIHSLASQTNAQIRAQLEMIMKYVRLIYITDDGGDGNAWDSVSAYMEMMLKFFSKIARDDIYRSDITYYANESVLYNNEFYICTVDGTKGLDPINNPANWKSSSPKITSTYVAGENILAGNVICNYQGQAYVATKDNGLRSRVVGIAEASALQGESIVILKAGNISAITIPDTTLPVFLGNSGGIVQNESSILEGEFRVLLGYPLADGSIDFQPGEPFWNAPGYANTNKIYSSSNDPASSVGTPGDLWVKTT
jgi:hypothetical protein